MSNHTRVFTLEGSSVSNSNTETLSDSDDSQWIIEQIQVVEQGGNSINDSTATISVSGTSFTDQNVDISPLAETYTDLPDWDLPWPSNSQFEFDWTNSESGNRTIDVLLWVRPATDSEISDFPSRAGD